MAYTPPVGSAVNFNFTTSGYVPQPGGSVDAMFGYIVNNLPDIPESVVIDGDLMHSPNWRTAPVVKREWKTSILSDLKGGEQRSALFTWPRRMLQYQFTGLTFQQAARLKRKLYANSFGVLNVPFWMDRTVLAASALREQPELLVESTACRNFEVGGTCVVYGNETCYEVRVIDSILPTKITLTTDLVYDWPAGVSVYPVLRSRIRSGQEMRMKTTFVGELAVEVIEEFNSDITRYAGDISSFPVYKGYPVFDVAPDWSDDVVISFYHPYETLSFIGKPLHSSHRDETEFLLQIAYTSFERESIQLIIDFFNEHRGRWGAFWLPTWQDDVKVVEEFDAGDDRITIESIQYPTYWENTVTGASVAIVWPDGSMVCLDVIAATSTQLVFDGVIGRDSGPLTFLMVSFLWLCRFDHDELLLRYLTDDKIRTELSFKTLSREVTWPES